MNIYEKLSNIQAELKAPKGQFNKFGGYKYRSCEDILEAVKPLCKKYKVVLILDDTLENIGNRYYIKAIAKLIDIEQPYEEWGDDIKSVNCICNSAYAREEETKKGMDGSQITGTASSYARKYALNGLFNIDDTKDADTDEYTKQTSGGVEDKISSTQATALEKAIENNNISESTKMMILDNYNYKSIEEIKVKDYTNIVNDLRKVAEQ